MAARGESFANTGVLQPNEMRMLAEQFRDPATIRGWASSNDARQAQLQQLTTMVRTVINRHRASVGQPPLEVTPERPAAAPAPSRIIDYDAQGRPIPPRAAQ
jgi:hypothetical protein